MVLDVEARDVLARTGTWKGDRGPSVDLPILLETGLPLPGSTQAVLVREEPAAPEDLLVVRDLGSSLRPLEAGATWAHVEVPAEQSLPPSLADALDEVPPVASTPGGVVEVVHGATSRMAGAERPGEGVEWTVMASAASMSRHPDRFVDAVIASRVRAGPARLLYLPGVATPRNMALLAYMGADVMDDVMCRLEAARGRQVRPELGHLHGPLDLDPEEVEGRNLALMGREVALVREAVAHGALRELVEVRVRSEPWQVAALRRLDLRHRDLLRSYCPVHRDRPLLALTRESLNRIEVAAWTEALMERYSPPPSAKVLLLLPCSARKPYSHSRTHRRLTEAMEGVRNRWAVHEVVLTSPLGAVPRELERMYPAAHYDIPVSGDWFPDEVERMRLLVERLRAVGSYDAVVSHMSEGLGFLRDDPSVTTTREKGEGALDRSALNRLSASVAGAAADAPRVEARARKAEDAASIARVQFGRAATDLLMHGTKVEGRPPALRILAMDGTQRGMVVPARGRISLTIEGASAMGEEARNRVWMDDFDLRGDLFAVGVLEVDPGIRPGEEVAVYRGEELTAVGLARMASAEMLEARRGAAVAVRHKAPGGGGG